MTSEQVTVGKRRVGIVEFFGEAKREIGKVSWPTRREIVQTTLLIVVFAIVAGLFFLLVDTGLGWLVSRILGMNS